MKHDVLNVMMRITTPARLLEWMSTNIKYGYWDSISSTIREAGPSMDKRYRLMSPSEVFTHKCGVCWDQVAFQLAWCKMHRIPSSAFYIELDDGKLRPTHTVMVFEHYKKIHMFENSFKDLYGISTIVKADSPKETIHVAIVDKLDSVVNAVSANAKIDRPAKVIVTEVDVYPNTGVSASEFMEACRKQRKIEFK